MTLGDQAKRLTAKIPTLSADYARQLINWSYRENCQRHGWQHLLKRFTLQTEAAYTTGTIAITTQTSAVTLTGGAWVTSWATAPSMRRMVLSGRAEPYDVTTFGSTTTATLADPFIGSTLTAGTYSLYRDVYPLPTDCGYAKLTVLYDPELRRRLIFLNQSKFIDVRAENPSLVSIPECFSVINQTSENPPRPQLQFYPASSAIRTFHGWYFRRPAFLTSDASYLDWPEEFDDMIWLLAAVEYYEAPLRLSQRNISVLRPKYANLFDRMKKEMDGNTAIDFDIEEAQLGRGNGWNPDVLGLSGSSSMSW